MTIESMEERVIRVLKALSPMPIPKDAHTYDVAVKTDLQTDLGFDSLDVTNLVVALEEEFHGLKLLDSDPDHFRNVANVMSAVQCGIERYGRG